MKIHAIKCCVLLVFVSTGAFSQKLSKNCTEVLAKPEIHPLQWINDCSNKTNIEDGYGPQQSEMSRSASRSENCTEFDPETCGPQPLNCLLGYLKGPDGCELCQCNDKGTGALFEGDIVVVNRLDEFIKNNYDDPERSEESEIQRGAAKDIQLWNNIKVGKTYHVPYVISNGIGSQGVAAIRAAAADFASKTCIRLVQRSSSHGSKNYINFYRGGGCSSPVGRVQKRQDVSLAAGCWQKGTVIHEVLHSLGFWHEQSRPDRDRHVRINWGNIPGGVRYNFNKFSYSQIDSRGSPYDLGSVMHYNGYAFSNNGQPTIVDLRGNPVRTQRAGFSTQDLFQLKAMYKCEGGTGGGGGGSNCEDKNSNCARWAADKNNNYCKTNQYVKDNCCKSCRGKPTTTTRPTTVKPTTSCTDKHQNCASWAQNGECTKNPAYMKPNCCKSCKSGGGGGSNCRDNNNNCAYWAKANYCSYNTYVRQNCRKSCRFC